jgi:Protein of unknown function (DUF2637)
MNANITTAARTAAQWIGRAAYTIAAIGVGASYTTQVELLHAHGVTGPFAWVLPSTLDLLAVAAAVALQLPNLDRASRRIAAAILLLTVSVSITANLAGGHNAVERAAHAWPIVAYLAGELLANRVRAYAARLAAAEEAAAKRSASAKAGAVTKAKRAARKPRARKLADPIAAIEALKTPAPVSPAPVTY